MHEKLAYAIKHYAWVQLLYKTVMSFVFRVLGCFTGFDEKLVLLSAMSGDIFGGSPRVLYERMRQDPVFKDYRYIWAFSHPEQFAQEHLEMVKIDSFRYFLMALRAKIWITDVNIERGLRFKKKRTIYLNTWHGTGPKKSGNAVAGRSDYDFSRLDILCVDGQYFCDLMIKNFNARKESMLWCGRPREDELLAFSKEDYDATREELGIPAGKKVILYMPTWREYTLKTLDYDLWESKLGDDYVVLVRGHHFSKDTMLEKENVFWLDVTAYPNVNRLYLVSDVLVSDYSSAFFDFGLLGKPMICFAYDYEQYKASTGLFVDLEAEFPGGLKRTDADVITHIREMDYEEESKRCKAYCDSYVSHPGNATETCISRLRELIENPQ